MQKEIENKIYSKPREMFDDTCLLIANQLKDSGFKYSQSQSVIKKKDKLLTYIISFYSSHYNYINDGKGHVALEFYCTIKNKKDIIFRLNQKELRSEVHQLELYNNESGKLDLKQIQNVIEFINTYFLPVISNIKTDVNTFLQKIANQPIARFDNYGFQYERKIFEIFNREDLIDKYNCKIEEFNNNKAIDNRIRFKKYLIPHFEKMNFEQFDTNVLWETLQKAWTSSKSETKMAKIYYEDYSKQYEKLSKKNISNKAEWLVEYYILLNACIDFIEDDKIKKQASNIYDKFLRQLLPPKT